MNGGIQRDRPGDRYTDKQSQSRPIRMEAEMQKTQKEICARRNIDMSLERESGIGGTRTEKQTNRQTDNLK